MLDLKIVNGTIIDGTGDPAYEGDIGVKEGRIVLPAEGEARQVIDASGKYVCPGFVDAHSHGDGILGSDFGALCKVS